jgi:hypothetical protein
MAGMMMRLNRAIALCMLAVIAMAGCDDRTAVPPAAVEQAKKASETPKGPALPTTQELTTGPRKRLALIPLPLTIEAPVGWGKLGDNNPAGIKVTSAGLNIIQGYTPSGPVQIQLTARPVVKEDALQRIVEAGKKEMAEKPAQIVKFELRPLGGVKVLERQSVGPARPFVQYDINGQEHQSMESSFNWSISVLVPNEGAYQDFQLSFIDLTKSHYDKESAFLNSIMNTLRYAGDTTPEATGLPATTVPGTTLPAQP